MTPGDVDVVCSAAGAHQLGDLLIDGLLEPVSRPLNEPDGWISEWWGRAFCGARVEWPGAVRPGVDHPDITDFGPTAAGRLESVRWRDWQVRVPPLLLQRAVSLRRGLTDRVEAIDALLQR